MRFTVGMLFYFEVLVDQNQVKGEKHTDGVNRIGGANPYPTVRRKRSPAQQSDQPAEDRVGDLNPEGKKSLLRLVVHKHVAISLSHECLLQWGVEASSCPVSVNAALFSSFCKSK